MPLTEEKSFNATVNINNDCEDVKKTSTAFSYLEYDDHAGDDKDDEHADGQRYVVLRLNYQPELSLSPHLSGLLLLLPLLLLLEFLG